MEFNYVMKQGARMCQKYICDDCPLRKEDCCPTVLSSFAREGKIEKSEQIIARWLAENPEPQYPTWQEWLTEKIR